MKITAIQTSNFLGARSVDVKLTKPVTIFAGKNFAGKSSLQEAIKMALTGESARGIEHKKDYKQLLSDNATVGYAMVDYAGEDAVERAAITLPNGAHELTAGSMPSALPYVLDAQRFARMEPNERRSFLFGLMGLRTDGATVSKRMLDRGCDAAKVEQITPHLRAGFDAGQKEAAGKARDAKAQWKTVTGGETYGEKKAEGWSAPTPQDAPGSDAVEEKKRDIAVLETAIAADQQTLGQMQGRAKDAAGRNQRIAELRDHAGKFSRIQDKLQRDRSELEEWSAKLAELPPPAGANPETYACPCCGGVLVMHGGALVEFTAEPATVDPDLENKRTQQQQAVDLYRSAVANGERDLKAANDAAERLKELETNTEPAPTDEEIVAHKRGLESKQAARKANLDELSIMQLAQRQAREADEKTKLAAELHHAVQQWDAIASALAHDGIPGEMLAEALDPINERLAASSNTAEWLRINIGRDMSIFAAEEGEQPRAYALLSESEKWRADAMIAEAISHISGISLLVLDRFDVLDLNGREDLMIWLDSLAVEGQIDTALIFGTLKALPAQLPESVGAFWLENGTVSALKAAA